MTLRVTLAILWLGFGLGHAFGSGGWIWLVWGLAGCVGLIDAQMFVIRHYQGVPRD